MHYVVLLILAAIWAAVLIPPALRARADASPADSIGAFRRQLSVLERTTPASASTTYRIAPYIPPSGTAIVVPRPAGRMSRSQARRRRRDIFVSLLGAVPVTLLVAVVVGSTALMAIHLLVDVAFAGYVALLVRARNLAAERDLKVRFLPQAAPSLFAQPELALRRSAN